MSSAVQAAMLVVMFVGAANADASPEQRTQLKDEMLPVLKDPETPPRQAMADAVKVTARIMGPSWRPKGEWDRWIMNLLDREELL